MNVSELFDLTHWVTDEIVATKIPQKYQALQQILQQHSKPNQQKQPFETQKNDLTKDQLLFLVVSRILCKIVKGQFFKEWQVLTHFSYRV